MSARASQAQGGGSGLPEAWQAVRRAYAECQQRRAEDLIRRILAVLGDHAPTAELDAALGALADALRASGRVETAGAVETARTELGLSVGRLHSRSTRASVTGSTAC